MMKNPENKKSKKRIHGGWIAAILIPILIVSSLLFVFSKYLYGVEYYSPTVTLEKYIDYIRTSQYEKAMQMVGLKASNFNGTKEYGTYFKQLYGANISDMAFTERKLKRTNNSLFYDVRINNKITQNFKLTKTDVKKMYIFDTWNIELLSPLTFKTVIIRTLPGIDFTINGKSVGKEYILPVADYSIDNYKNVKDSNKNITVKTLKIPEIAVVSSIEALTSSGAKCKVDLLSDKNQEITYSVKMPISESFSTEIKSAAEKITKKYTEYVQKETSFSKLSPMIYKNTKIYDDLRTFYNGWATPHDSQGFGEVKFFDLQYFDDNHTTVGVEFNYFVFKFGKRFDYTVNYHVYMLKVNGIWMLADLSIA